MEKENLRISNVVCTGKLPFNKKINFAKIVKKSNFDWVIVNEEICPILQVFFLRKEKDLNVHIKRKRICISIWYSGAVNIVGVLSLAEAQKYYDKVTIEIKKICPDVRRS